MKKKSIILSVGACILTVFLLNGCGGGTSSPETTDVMSSSIMVDSSLSGEDVSRDSSSSEETVSIDSSTTVDSHVGAENSSGDSTSIEETESTDSSTKDDSATSDSNHSTESSSLNTELPILPWG